MPRSASCLAPPCPTPLARSPSASLPARARDHVAAEAVVPACTCTSAPLVSHLICGVQRRWVARPWRPRQPQRRLRDPPHPCPRPVPPRGHATTLEPWHCAANPWTPAAHVTWSHMRRALQPAQSSRRPQCRGCAGGALKQPHACAAVQRSAPQQLCAQPADALVQALACERIGGHDLPRAPLDLVEAQRLRHGGVGVGSWVGGVARATRSSRHARPRAPRSGTQRARAARAPARSPRG